MERCAENGICAEAWNSEISPVDRESIERELLDSETSLKLLYTTPESLLSDKLKQLLKVSSCVPILLVHPILQFCRTRRLTITDV